MRLLLDTHLLSWAEASSERLSREARALIEGPENEVYYSAAGRSSAFKALLDRYTIKA
ncbi:MAG: hypothetical protein HY525_11895 [Betaproteobacteria bacterium]|nr:hypothetical protein [Betaproteobacteria bacterium]